MPNIKINYSPRTWQVDFHKAIENHRFVVALVHRRAGKTVSVANEIIMRAMTCQHKNPRVAYICPEKAQAKNNVWQYLLDYTADIPDRVVYKADLTIQVPCPNGIATLIVAGADNPDNLRGAYFDFVVLDEASDYTDDNVWYSVIRPMLSDRHGKAVITGTVKGERFLWQMYEKALNNNSSEWATIKLNPYETMAIEADELKAIERETPWDIFQQEYMNNPYAAVKGAYWGETLKTLREEKKITHVPWVRTEPVYVGWDLGGTVDPICVWFMQYIDGSPHLIDFHKFKSPCTLEEACKFMNLKKYNYGKFFLPHDAAVRVSSVGFKPRKEIIEDLTNVKCTIVKKANNSAEIKAQIDLTDIFLSRCRIDSVNCSEGLRDISLYTPAYDSKTGTFGDRPKKSQFEDASDALRYLAVGFNPNITGQVNYRVKGSFDALNASYDSFDPLELNRY